jgi:hypothetical protein
VCSAPKRTLYVSVYIYISILQCPLSGPCEKKDNNKNTYIPVPREILDGSRAGLRTYGSKLIQVTGFALEFLIFAIFFCKIANLAIFVRFFVHSQTLRFSIFFCYHLPCLRHDDVVHSVLSGWVPISLLKIGATLWFSHWASFIPTH